MKRFLSFALTLVMMLTMFAGCTPKEPASAPAEAEAPAKTEAEAAAEPET